MKFPLILILIFSLTSVSANSFAHGDTGSAGAGVGASYGFVGVSFDKKLVQNLYGSIGIGNALDGAGYNIGLRYYLTDANRVWRPRIVANYGTNGVLAIEERYCYYSCDEDYDFESFVGSSFGLGQSIAFGSGRNHGFELDFLYVADDGGMEDRMDELEARGYDVEQENTSFYFSIGYRYSF